MAGTVGFSVITSMLVHLLHCVPVNPSDPVACVPQIQVRKNTNYSVSRGNQLNISCHVTYCHEVPDVKWIKFDTHILKSRTTTTKDQAGAKKMISHLRFGNISPADNGTYRCFINTSKFSSQSHSINVIVLDSIKETKINNTTGPPQEKETEKQRLLYVFIFLGTLGLVLIMMLISFLCITRNLRKKHRNKNTPFCLQPLNTTLSEKSQKIPAEQNNLYDDATSDDLHPEPVSSYTGNDRESTLSVSDGNRNSDESQKIIYASLQHHTPQEPTAVYHQSRDQLSEYASIRISQKHLDIHC